MSIQPTQKFQIGLCMAGAVSAGSYTAGVMDYLTEALEEWEKRKGTAGIPTHEVEIPVMGGASAGGMTSIITAAALQQGIKHLDKPTDTTLITEHPENLLYHSWVDLTDTDMFARMLDISDIKPCQVEALLNSDFIDVVAQRALAPVMPPTFSWPVHPKFLAPQLKIFTTLTNLQGFLYDVSFKSDASGERNPYYMTVHNDYACFELSSDSLDPVHPGWIPLSIKRKQNVQIAMECAMATGAFPVGLKSRLVHRPTLAINNDVLTDPEMLKATQLTGDSYTTLNVDGGLINNEPFDKIRQVLVDATQQTQKSDYQDYTKFTSTILMVAPFPSSKPSEISLSQNLTNIIGLTLSAMLSQMRAKSVNMVDAMDSNCAGQYLIAPSRRVPGPDGKEESIQGEHAIACGAMGGFSGFLNKEFRIHDYYLGRYNCKIFLRDYFTMPASAVAVNPIFRDGYAGIDLSRFTSKVDGSIQIIPVFENVDYTFPIYNFKSGTDWPTIQGFTITNYNKALKNRIQAIMLNIADLRPGIRFILKLAAGTFLNQLISDKVMKVILGELKKWNLVN